MTDGFRIGGVDGHPVKNGEAMVTVHSWSQMLMCEGVRGVHPQGSDTISRLLLS